MTREAYMKAGTVAVVVAFALGWWLGGQQQTAHASGMRVACKQFSMAPGRNVEEWILAAQPITGTVVVPTSNTSAVVCAW